MERFFFLYSGQRLSYQIGKNLGVYDSYNFWMKKWEAEKQAVGGQMGLGGKEEGGISDS